MRRVQRDDWELLRELRLSALEVDRTSFGSTHERNQALPEEQWREWAEEGAVTVARRLYAAAGYEPDGAVEESPHTPGLRHESLTKLLQPRGIPSS